MVQANMHGVDLTGARLWRARGLETDLSDAVLVRADLGEARLRRVNLKRANLGSARLVSAKLQQAQAGNNAFFRRAQFDEPALKSLVLAEHWQDANFADATSERLQRLAET